MRDGEIYWLCSDCTNADRVVLLHKYKPPLCGNCGADMDYERQVKRLKKELAKAQAEAARYKASLENIYSDFMWSLSAAKQEAKRGLKGGE